VLGANGKRLRVWALRELIKNESGILSWKTDPDKFLEDNLAKTAEVYLLSIA
jgi:hypothetical protein